MHKMLVLYNDPKDPAHFRKYYVETHLPLVSKLPNLKASRYSFDVKSLAEMGIRSRQARDPGGTQELLTAAIARDTRFVIADFTGLEPPTSKGTPTGMEPKPEDPSDFDRGL